MLAAPPGEHGRRHVFESAVRPVVAAGPCPLHVPQFARKQQQHGRQVQRMPDSFPVEGALQAVACGQCGGAASAGADHPARHHAGLRKMDGGIFHYPDYFPSSPRARQFDAGGPSARPRTAPEPQHARRLRQGHQLKLDFNSNLSSGDVRARGDRCKHASLFDHQGQVLRNYVGQALDTPDVALQLPTGSGKTLVGLRLAEWRRRKFRERIGCSTPARRPACSGRRVSQRRRRIRPSSPPALRCPAWKRDDLSSFPKPIEVVGPLN